MLLHVEAMSFPVTSLSESPLESKPEVATLIARNKSSCHPTKPSRVNGVELWMWQDNSIAKYTSYCSPSRRCTSNHSDNTGGTRSEQTQVCVYAKITCMI